MAGIYKLIKVETLVAIADALRTKYGTTGSIPVIEYAQMILDIQTGIEPTGSLNVIENGTYDVTEYAQVVINVPQNNEPEGSIDITSNGTHSVAWLASVNVNVPQNVEEGANDGLIDNSLSTFVMPSGKTSIYKYAFYYKTSLTTIDITGATSIGDYAFRYSGITSVVIPSTVTSIGSYALSDCTSLNNAVINNNTLVSYQFYNDTSLATVTVSEDSTLTSIPSYCFQNCKSLKSFPFSRFKTFNDYCFNYAGANNSADDAIDLLLTGANIKSYAFQYANIKTINVDLNNNYLYAYTFDNAYNTESIVISNWKTSTSSTYGNYAFRNNKAKSINMSNIASYYKNYMFDGCTKVEELIGVKPIGTIYDYCFRGLASKRESSGRFVLDLSAGTFTAINQYAFANLVDTDVILPSTVTTINANAFNGCSGLHLFLSSSPKLSNVSAFASNKDLIIFTEFGNIGTLAGLTNWASYSDSIYGYRLGSNFENGVFPTETSTGIDVLWYTDMTLSTIASNIDNENTYYCILGPVYLKSTGLNCTVLVTDEDGNSYSNEDRILLGKTLTIQFVPVEGQSIPYKISVNGQDYDTTDFSNTISGIIMESDLSVTGIYWDGTTLPLDPVMANNSWDMIKEGIRSGAGLDIGWSIGDTKSITTIDGKTFTIRLCDTTEGRYTYSDGTSTKAVFEFVEGLPDYMTINDSTKEGYYTGGGWAECDMNKTKLPTFLQTLPEDLRNAIEEVNIPNCYSYTSPSPRTAVSKLFLPNECEIWGTRYYGNSIETTTQFGLYAQRGAEALKKIRLGQSSYDYFWMRSPFSGDTYNFVMWKGSSCNNYYAYSNFAVAPCFAI